jgi:hypothetical protein
MYLLISHNGDDSPVAMLHTNTPEKYFDNQPGDYFVVYHTDEPADKIWKLDLWFPLTLDRSVDHD